MGKGLVVVAIVAVAIGFLFLYEEVTHMDTTAHETPSIGKLVTLSHGGAVHYVLRGPENGSLVVLVHGISSSEGIWQWIAKDLVTEGFQVLSYDLYGRGLSDHVLHTAHDADLYTGQLHELLEKLGFGDRAFDLVGYSMGGAVASLFAAKHMDRIRKLVLISPAGMPFDMPLLAKVATLPVIGELLANSAFSRRGMVTRTKSGAFVAPEKIPEQYDFFQSLTHYHVYKKEGFLSVMASTLRNFPLTNCTDAFKTIGEKGKFPVKIIWGTIDTTTPYSGAQQALALIPRANLVTVEDIGHSVLLEESARVYPEIVRFLKE